LFLFRWLITRRVRQTSRQAIRYRRTQSGIEIP
jgi:hypothetical protein